MRTIILAIALCAILVPAAARAQQQTYPHAATGSTTITTGGTAQTLFGASEVGHGFMIYNPQSASQQGIATAESLFVDITGGTPTTSVGGTILEILPGVAFVSPAGVLVPTVKVIATTTGHHFSAFQW